MRIHNTHRNPYPSTPLQPKEHETANKNNGIAKDENNGIIKDEFVKTNQEKEVTYHKPNATVDTKTIQRLKEVSERNYNHLREMVRQLLEKQGMTFKDLEITDAVVDVDEATRLEAQAMIGEGGPLSPEVLSDKIVEFAIAISGGDKEKFDLLKDAIDQGFKEAAKALGGELPEISKKTYDLVMEKLNKWKEE